MAKHDPAGDRNGKRKKHMERSCLKCDRKFMSKGIYNRLCPECVRKMVLYHETELPPNYQGWIYVG